MPEGPLTPDHILAQLARLREEYFERSPKELDALAVLARQLSEQGADAESLASLHQRLHKLAGSGGTFGLSSLSVAAREIEQRVAGWIETGAPSVDAPAITRVLADIEALACMAVNSIW